MISLYTKVLSSVGLVLFVAMLAIEYVNFKTQEKVILVQIDKTSKAYLSSFENNILSYKKNLKLASFIISKDPSVARSLHLQNSRGINKKLNDLSKLFPYYHYILLTGLEKEVFAVSTRNVDNTTYLGEELLGLDITNHPLYKQINTNELFMSSIAKDPYLKLIEKEVVDAQWQISPVIIKGKHIGWLVCSFDWNNEIKKFIKDVKENLLKEDIPVIDLYVKEVGKYEYRNNNNEVLRESKIISFGGINYEITILFNKEVLFEPVDELIMQSVTIFILSFIILLVIIYFTLHFNILARIDLLKKAASQFRQGNLDYRVKYLGKDELGMFAKTMNEMAYDLQETIMEVADARDSLELKVKQRTEEIEKNKQELERSNQELDEFAFIASHDLKAPLRNIENYSNFLMEDYADKLDDDGKGFINSISRLSAKMAELLSNLLYYSRVGRAGFAIKETNLKEVISDIKESISLQIEEENVVISVAENLPTIQCDTTRITEVYRNLIMNAIKYNENDKKIIECGVRYSGKDSLDEKDIYFVKDNGIGIKDSHKELVFKIFKRLNTKDKYGEGTGAGLTIIKKILKRHNGDIWVESEEGKGSIFCFTIGKYEGHESE